MSRRALTDGSPLPVLGAAWAAELVINRLAVPALRPSVRPGDPTAAFPLWHTLLDYLGLFIFYFAAALSLIVLGRAAARAARIGLGDRGFGRVSALVTAGAAAVVVGLGALSTVGVALGEQATLIVELAFALGVGVTVVRGFTGGRDRAVALGVALTAAPLLLHGYGVLGARWLWAPETLDAAVGGAAGMIVTAMSLLAIASPYTLGPRPLARSMVRVVPMLAAVLVAGGSLLLARTHYDVVVELGARAADVALSPDRPDRGLAMYVLAVATLAWTLTSCALADAIPRRRIGAGLALVVLGGGALAWPGALAALLLGLLVIVDEAARVRAAEQLGPAPPATPTIDDQVWQGYVSKLVASLRERGHQAQALTTRGGDDVITSVVAGHVGQQPLQVRVQRRGGAAQAGSTSASGATCAATRSRRCSRGRRPAREPAGGGARRAARGRRGGAPRRRRLRRVLPRARRRRPLAGGARRAGARGWRRASRAGVAAWDGQSVRLGDPPWPRRLHRSPDPRSPIWSTRGHVDGGVEPLLATIELLAVIADRVLPPPSPRRRRARSASDA
ncbi:MAG: hypothetical protein R2939_08830 [Kofleriaceae bacterium]